MVTFSMCFSALCSSYIPKIIHVFSMTLNLLHRSRDGPILSNLSQWEHPTLSAIVIDSLLDSCSNSCKWQRRSYGSLGYTMRVFKIKTYYGHIAAMREGTELPSSYHVRLKKTPFLKGIAKTNRQFISLIYHHVGNWTNTHLKPILHLLYQ